MAFKLFLGLPFVLLALGLAVLYFTMFVSWVKAGPPLMYNIRSVLVRWQSTLLTIVSVGATVAVVAGIFALQQGFASLYSTGGRSDVAIFLRPGANSEGESSFRRSSADILKKETPGIAVDESGQPLASGEIYLAVRRRKVDGGETNVPIRGVEPMSLKIAGDRLKVLEGRAIQPGTDEVMVGVSLANRIRNCQVGEVITINVTPFKVVGIFDYDGPFRSEIWGDLDRMGEALQRPGYNRIIAQLQPGTNVETLAARLEDDKRTPAKLMTEKAYLATQTGALSGILFLLAGILGTIMGAAAVMTGINTLNALFSARSHEIGVMVAIGYKPGAVFFAFTIEALLIGLLGGLAGCLMVLPLNGVQTGTTNFQTFTEVAFAFRITPPVLIFSISFAMILGFIGGLVPAWQAAHEDPVTALRRK